MSNMIIDARDDSFSALLASATTPVLIDFWAPWCGPCKALTPVLDEVAKEFKEKAVVIKINVDENPITQKKYNVRSIPTLALVKNGELLAVKTGVLSKAQVVALLDLAT